MKSADRIRELEAKLEEANARYALKVYALRDEIASLKAQLVKTPKRASSEPSAEAIARRDKRIAELLREVTVLRARAARVANVSNGSIVMTDADQKLIKQCLHPDWNPSPAKKTLMLTKAFQVFNALSIRAKP